MGSVASVRPANSRLTNQRGSANLVMSDRATTRCALCLEPNPLPQSHVGPLTTLPTSKTNKKNSISTTHSFPATFFPSAQPLRPQHRHHPHPTGSPSLIATLSLSNMAADSVATTESATKVVQFCAKCQLPLAGQFVRALGGTFHFDCFTCMVSIPPALESFTPCNRPNHDGSYPTSPPVLEEYFQYSNETPWLIFLKDRNEGSELK